MFERARAVVGTAAEVWTLSDRVHLGLISAGVAFFAMFALFPALAALIALFGLVADPSVVQTQLDLMREVMPEAAFQILDGQLQALLSARSDRLGWATLVSLGVALWSARAGVAALMRGLNALHGRPNRAGVLGAAVALALTLSLITMAAVALLTVVVAPVALALLPMPRASALILEALRWIVVLFILLGGLGLLYRFGPNLRGRRPGWVTPGAVLAVAVWLAASAGFSAYLAKFARYNEVYGSIGAAAALLMWLYISAWLVLMGAALNAVLDRRRRHRAETAAQPVAGD